MSKPVEILRKIFSYKIIRYLCAGGTAAVLNLAVLAILVSGFHVWYLLATTIAFLVSLGASFSLHKFLTFLDASLDTAHVQLAAFCVITLVNLGVNIGSMYIGVDLLKVPYILSQIIVNIGIALYSYFVYQHLIFSVSSGSTV